MPVMCRRTRGVSEKGCILNMVFFVTSTEDFEVRQLMAPGGDVEVPITVVHRRDVQLNGCNPLLLHGYGAYGTQARLG